MGKPEWDYANDRPMAHTRALRLRREAAIAKFDGSAATVRPADAEWVSTHLGDVPVRDTLANTMRTLADHVQADSERMQRLCTTWGMDVKVGGAPDLAARLAEAWDVARVPHGPMRIMWASQAARDAWAVEVQRQAWLRGEWPHAGPGSSDGQEA